jgi:hypothetical protein
LVVNHTLPDACVSVNMTASRVKKTSLDSAMAAKLWTDNKESKVLPRMHSKVERRAAAAD